MADADDYRPWEQPGEVRRDLPPHRGHLLLLLGRACVAVGVLSLFTCVPGMPGMVFGMVALSMADNDLRRMADGKLDPRGRAEAERAAVLANRGTFLCFISFAVWPLFMLVAIGALILMSTADC